MNALIVEQTVELVELADFSAQPGLETRAVLNCTHQLAVAKNVLRRHRVGCVWAMQSVPCAATGSRASDIAEGLASRHRRHRVSNRALATRRRCTRRGRRESSSESCCTGEALSPQNRQLAISLSRGHRVRDRASLCEAPRPGRRLAGRTPEPSAPRARLPW